MPDRITLRGVAASGRHGWYDAERVAGQPFRVDLGLDLDTRPAAASDDLSDTVDYAVLARAVAAVVEGEPVRLLETLAARIADTCLADARVAAAEVTVHKPQADLGVPVSDVAVTVRRTR